MIEKVEYIINQNLNIIYIHDATFMNKILNKLGNKYYKMRKAC